MDVTEESVCIYGTIIMSWIDEILTWNPADHGGIQEVSPPSEMLWRPNIAFSRNPSVCNDRNSKVVDMVTLSNDGTVNFLVHGYIGALCNVDVKMFPFDHHACGVRFFDHTKSMKEIVLQTQDHLAKHEISYPHAEWIVHDIASSMDASPMPGNRSNIAVYGCMFKVSRRPGFIIIHNIIPAGFVILLSLFVPFIPPDTGERLSYAITTYLATVFMTVSFYENIPNNSLCFTLMSYDLVIYYAISSLSLIWSIAVVCLSRQSSEKMKIPNFIINRVQKIKNDSTNYVGISEISLKTVEQEADKTEEIFPQKYDKTSDKSLIGWYEASRYLDKMFFIFTLTCYTFLIGWNVLVISVDEFNACKPVHTQ
ncbi:hypothetical protein ACF0H5_000848 [Mactra antiquata]